MTDDKKKAALVTWLNAPWPEGAWTSAPRGLPRRDNAAGALL
jgi:hypothetical protein